MKTYKMGTAEPIFKKYDDKDTAGFLRGFLVKYGRSRVTKKDMLQYLRGLVRLHRPTP